MSLELWEKRIIKDAQGQRRRFGYFNAATNGMGHYLEFVEISGPENERQLTFRSEVGEGSLWLCSDDGRVRDPFLRGAWFLGRMTRHGQPCLVRFRFMDEISGGSEQGTRIFTQWQHGEWKKFPRQTIEGKLIDAEPNFYFGWSVNGNAYHHEPKPELPAEEKKEVKKAPKTFGGTASTAETTEVKTEEPAVKKPKVFVPKTKPAVEPPSSGT